MTYDNYGNIVSKNGVAYTYGDDNWKDLLTGYGDKTITYDAQGNPVNYLGHTLTWEKGRQLKQFTKTDGTVIDYTYNANGIRTSKTVNGVKHTYTLDGTKILRETWTKDGVNHSIVPMYDNEDSACGIQYNGEPYYFQKNLQGDIIAIIDKDANTVARYSYDAWGVCTITEDVSGCNIAEVNPYRYRGYYSDAEIEMYYLQSRYYNPVVGRFINSDEVVFGTLLIKGYSANSLFTYSVNNPVVYLDRSGYYDIKAYEISSDTYYQMMSMSAAVTSLLASIKAFVGMIWNIVLVVGLLLVVISSIIYVCNTVGNVYTTIQSKIKVEDEEYKKFSGKICVYVLARKKQKMDSIFYVGRTKDIIRRYKNHKKNKGTFFMYVVYVCSSTVQSRVVEQSVLATCLAGGFTDIIFGCAPSNKIRSVSIKQAEKVIENLKDELPDTISLLACTPESDLLFMMNQ